MRNNCVNADNNKYYLILQIRDLAKFANSQVPIVKLQL